MEEGDNEQQLKANPVDPGINSQLQRVAPLIFQSGVWPKYGEFVDLIVNEISF